MKKFVLLTTLLISVIANAQISYKEYYHQNKIAFDFGMGAGTYFGCSELKYTVDMDFTVKNVLFGFGFGGEESDGHFHPRETKTSQMDCLNHCLFNSSGDSIVGN